MDKLAILALLHAKAGKENEVEQFLKSAQPLAVSEAGTTTWYGGEAWTDRRSLGIL